ncbi:M56 family metallopeptidase [Amnibacterium flavum]|uniref:M56 family metallopeptidase n=1 Tax=Amnibacterium flavum TaxID=2173173 RepID=UPI001F0C54B8|nr:M56 family metallopeptidase [Amnibacterium flavum]
MLTAPLLLALLAVALAWPVPLWLASARWPRRSPALALLLWQSIALAGGLSMIGALLTYGLLPFGTDLLHGLTGFAQAVADGSAADRAGLAHLAALFGAALLGIHLLLNLAIVVLRTDRDRRRHRALLDLLGSTDPSQPRTRILDSELPVAYCLPSSSGSITVFSAGLISLLDDEELRAVTEHERAHLTQRHDLVLVAFRAWYASLPWFPVAYRAQREVGMLIEMLADDRARTHVEDRTLARAIALVGNAGEQSGLAVATRTDELQPQAIARVTRLGGEIEPLPPIARVAVVSTAAALLVVPTALLLLPALLTLGA